MRLAKTFLALGIAMIFAVFIAYGVYVFYEPPKYDFDRSPCYDEYNCENYTAKCMPRKVAVEPEEIEYIEENCYEKAQSNPEYKECLINRDKCDEQYIIQTDSYKHAKISFYILTIIGIAAIIGGMFLTEYEGIGSGFIGGGVLLILWTLPYTSRYWLTLSKYLRLTALGIVLAILIYFGYKKLEKH